mmetsp:Transcript_48617/g.117579  ORF Transcript_48617/g.117579 Transcript_48617/m.117579 type:complete len:393 (-) Transcript_48617:179-1357(-)
MVNAQATKQVLRNVVTNRDANRFADTFRLPPIAAASSSSSGSSAPKKHQPQSFTIGDRDYGGLLTPLLDAIAATEAGDASAAFDSQISLHSNFNRLYASSEGSWFVPALLVVCKNTSLLSQKAGDTQNRAPNVLQESFSRSVNDRTDYDPTAPYDTDGSKKSAALGIVNELFAMYFRMNQLRLCKTLIRPLEQKKLHINGSMSAMVTYRYYHGRLLMFEDQHAAAEESLEYAFRHCHKDALHNKRCILMYLVPVKLVQGKIPSPQLLSKYNLEQFKPIVDGIKKGDLRTFQDGLVQYQDRFIGQGTYLLLEKCKTQAYRNLFKRIHGIVDDHKISLEHMAVTFKWLGMPIDNDEIECILANLIFKGVVRGYISHQKRILVLSKRDPFPQQTG